MMALLQRHTQGAGQKAWLTEMAALVALAAPLVATQLAQMAVLTTDVIMLGRLGKEALAGSALGLTIFNFAFMFAIGPAVSVSPMIAHILGANPKDIAGVRAVVRMGLWVALLFSLPLVMMFWCAEAILITCGQEPALAHAAAQFIRPLSFGLPAVLGYQVLRNYATALRLPRAALIVMILTILFNALGAYALIFGHFGLPRLGLVGSGIASACSYTFSFLAMVAVVQLSPTLRSYRIWRRFHRPDWGRFREVLRLGIPTGLTSLFEGALFMGSTLMMGTFGAAAVAAHQVAINVASITFMVPLGIAQAATVRVGLAAGAENGPGVRRAGYSALTLSISFMSLCGLCFALFAPHIAALYIASDSPANADAIALTASFLQIAALFQIFDGIQVTSSLNLRGLKDARLPMWIAAISYWGVGFPVCFLLSRHMQLGGIGVWLGLATSLFVAAAAMALRFDILSRRRLT